MAINKKLIHFKSKQKFEEELANGNILETSIVFILETTEIYTHGKLYDGSTFDPSNIEVSIENIINNKADKSELPTKTSDLTNDSGFITINDVLTESLLKTYTFLKSSSTDYLLYNITQEELEKIQNADIVYIFIDDRKNKIQLTSKIENDYIAFLGYDLNSYPNIVIIINVTVQKISDNIAVLILSDQISVGDYISDYISNLNTSYAIGFCYSEEFVDEVLIEIVENLDIIMDSVLGNYRPIILTLININGDKTVFLHGPYVLTIDTILSLKFIGEYNDLTIECVLSSEDNYLLGTLHIKSKQDKLVSGINIKTINGESILGEGDITLAIENNTVGNTAIAGKLNLTNIDEIKAAQSALSKTNDVAFYLVTDSNGKIPSSRGCYDIPSDNVKQLSLTSPNSITNGVLALATSSITLNAVGVNVGDLVALTRVQVKVSDLTAALGISLSLSGEIEIYQYKILSMNDAKPTGHWEASAGVMGLMSPWDKGQVNKISGIESTANNALPKNDLLPSRWEANMNNALQTGVYPWCDFGRPAGSTGHYTCIVNRTSTDDGAYNTIEQTAYGREAELGQVYKRIIFEKTDGTDTQFGEWVKVSNGGLDIADGAITTDKIANGAITADKIAEEVRTSLGKADTALQSHQDISGKQDKLVNGVNIKTINGLSLLGSGILTISGNSTYPQINHGTSNTTCMLQPNLFYVWDTVTELNLAFDEGVANEANEYLFLFTSGETATTLFVPDDIKWTDGFIIIDANKIYQISILNGLGTVMSWDI